MATSTESRVWLITGGSVGTTFPDNGALDYLSGSAVAEPVAI